MRRVNSAFKAVVISDKLQAREKQLWRSRYYDAMRQRDKESIETTIAWMKARGLTCHTAPCVTCGTRIRLHEDLLGNLIPQWECGTCLREAFEDTPSENVVYYYKRVKRGW